MKTIRHYEIIAEIIGGFHIDDVLQVEPSLTKEQTREVFSMLKSNYDASIGINWDVIEITIQTYMEGLKK